MSSDALRQASREARAEAAPFVVLAMLMNLALAAVSERQGWVLGRGVGWWIWLIAAVPYAVLAVVLLLGLGANRSARQRREFVVILLAIVVAFSGAETLLLIGALVDPGRLTIGGAQLLQSAVTLWVTNVIAFGLAFWEIDCGGPVRRALSGMRKYPDFQFPQDENPGLAPPGWVTHLHDYLYLSTTNSIAFSPTDAMPLTRTAKGLMALESALSVAAIVIVAARAVNILST